MARSSGLPRGQSWATAKENPYAKQLRGLLPICASCKKIGDDQGYWALLEIYIQEHSQAEFTHGLCPECVHKFFPGRSAKTTPLTPPS